MGIDNVFRKPIEAGLIPGVVALAADDRGVVCSVEAVTKEQRQVSSREWLSLQNAPQDVEVLILCGDGRVYTAIWPDIPGPQFFCITVGGHYTDLDKQRGFSFEPIRWCPIREREEIKAGDQIRSEPQCGR
jgi:hypothetical protein